MSGDSPLRVSDVLHLWQTNASFRSFFTESVRDCGFDAFFWETPPVTLASLDNTFEFVVVEGVSLGWMSPDPQAFSEHFSSPSVSGVVTFPNLGGDATLVVPAPVATDHACYTHLGRFLLSAPAQQVDQFWQTVGEAMQRRVSAWPVWLSTNGTGVSWLHMRLDSLPKYYCHKPYTKSPRPA